MSEWQPIESAPRDGTQILLWTDTRLMPDAEFYLAIGGEHFSVVQIGHWEEAEDAPMRKQQAHWEAFKCGEPTHWMPLPEPPGADLCIPIYASRDATDGNYIDDSRSH